MLNLVLLLVIAAIFGYFIAKTPTRNGSQAVNTVETWWSNLSLGGKPQSFEAFKTSVAASSLPDDFKSWFNSLSPREAKEFYRSIEQFASQRGFDLQLITDERTKAEAPRLQQSLQEAVTSYCLAYWQGATSEEDVQTYEAFKAWNEQPFSRSNRELSERLFAKLVAKKKIDTAVSSQLITASAKERQEHVVNSIREFAQKDSEAFFTIFKEVLNEPENAKTEAKSTANESNPATAAAPTG